MLRFLGILLFLLTLSFTTSICYADTIYNCSEVIKESMTNSKVDKDVGKRMMSTYRHSKVTNVLYLGLMVLKCTGDTTTTLDCAYKNEDPKIEAHIILNNKDMKISTERRYEYKGSTELTRTIGTCEIGEDNF